LIVALQVELVSPERILYSGEADMVIARSAGGDIAFLTGHAPFVGTLGVAQLRIRPSDGGGEVAAAVHGGFVEVKNDRVTILSDVAELASQIDVDRARASLAQAIADVDEAARRRAEVRLEVAGASA
jgi:F-type H+-transporting ATPase subunit epsilon